MVHCVSVALSHLERRDVLITRCSVTGCKLHASDVDNGHAWWQRATERTVRTVRVYVFCRTLISFHGRSQDFSSGGDAPCPPSPRIPFLPSHFIDADYC